MSHFWGRVFGHSPGGSSLLFLRGALFGAALSALACNGVSDSGPAASSAGECGGNAAPASAKPCTGGTNSAMWTTDGAKYALTFGSTYLEIDPANGARITALRLGGSTGFDLLADSASTGQADNFGSTFWPSPQNWPWPPTSSSSIGAINSSPYTVARDDLSATFTSALNSAPPTLVVTKKISADVAREAIVIEYKMTNGGSEPVTVAPWEVTRVPAGGITFYAGASAPIGRGTPLMTTSEAAGATWYAHDPNDATEYKLFADGKGWLAHAASNLLLIKTFPDISAQESPDGEAEIEIFAAARYVEVEQQGRVQTLAAGESLDWTVRWYARTLAEPAALGSAKLVAYVLNQIK